MSEESPSERRTFHGHVAIKLSGMPTCRLEAVMLSVTEDGCIPHPRALMRATDAGSDSITEAAEDKAQPKKNVNSNIVLSICSSLA